MAASIRRFRRRREAPTLWPRASTGDYPASGRPLADAVSTADRTRVTEAMSCMSAEGMNIRRTAARGLLSDPTRQKTSMRALWTLFVPSSPFRHGSGRGPRRADVAGLARERHRERPSRRNRWADRRCPSMPPSCSEPSTGTTSAACRRVDGDTSSPKRTQPVEPPRNAWPGPEPTRVVPPGPAIGRANGHAKRPTNREGSLCDPCGGAPSRLTPSSFEALRARARPDTWDGGCSTIVRRAWGSALPHNTSVSSAVLVRPPTERTRCFLLPSKLP